jgi:hypothetical protein
MLALKTTKFAAEEKAGTDSVRPGWDAVNAMGRRP